MAILYYSRAIQKEHPEIIMGALVVSAALYPYQNQESGSTVPRYRIMSKKKELHHFLHWMYNQ